MSERYEDGVLEILGDQTIVPERKYQKENDSRYIRKVILPSSVTAIGPFAFGGRTDLEEVVFAEGLLSISICAFHECIRLKSISVPGSLREIGKGAFVKCGDLREVNIAQGDYCQLRFENTSFRDCPAQSMAEKTINAELQRRRERALSWLYDEVFRHEGGEASRGCRDACEEFSKIDWANATDEELRPIFFDTATRVARLSEWSDVSEDDWIKISKGECRSICVNVMKLDAEDADLSVCVAGIHDRFNAVFGGNKITRFNRVIASLRPDLVVQVCGVDVMDLVYDWLRKSNLLTNSIYGGDEWFNKSHAARLSMSQYLKDKSIYESGTFLWFLAETLRGTNQGKKVQERMQMIKDRLAQVGL